MGNSKQIQRLIDKLADTEALREYWMRIAQDHKEEAEALRDRVRELEAVIASLQKTDEVGASE